MEFDHVRYDLADGIAEIAIDRPEVLNAFDETTIEELIVAIETALDDDAAYVVLLTGTGRAFCAGADLTVADDRNREFESVESSVEARREYMDYAENVVDVVRLLHTGEKPTLAAVNGPALGAGSDFALACDLRVMAEDGVLREQFVNLGFVAADGGGWLLPRLVGDAKATEYLLTGRDIPAEEAVDVGLAVEVAPSEEMLEVARELAAEIRDKPALGVRYTKALIRRDSSFEEYVTDGLAYQWEARNDPEQAEAVAAFVEDSEPLFDREY